MRLGVISDVHGNLHALRATIDVLRREGVDGWLSVGDLIGYGPNPNECVEMVAGLGAIAVAGNHELIVLGQIAGAASSERAHESHRWTRRQLRDDVVSYLQGLPRQVRTNGIMVTHGSLGDPEEYVRTPARAVEQLEQLRRDHPEDRILVLGNTHRQQLHAERSGRQPVPDRDRSVLDLSQRYLVNPGSVGQSREWEWPPAARALLLDVERNHAEFRVIRYDVKACLRELRRHGLSYRSMHAPPSVRAAVRRRVVTAVRTKRAPLSSR